ncbi:hypothetical protein NVP1197A_59 [Vibrio phage 1.197.A._10N.286.54.F2]|nr:hypothetical protein NVP1197A_59 [Vibrio phage 1.197.A._10N.286.54.F2]
MVELIEKKTKRNWSLIVIELRYWNKNQARARYDEMLNLGKCCNMSKDGCGIIVRMAL